MDEKILRNYAIKAGKKITNDLNENAVKIEWIEVEPSEVKVKGIYRQPFSNKWELHFNDKSENSVSSWVINYEPKTNLSDEEHIEEILSLLWEQQSFR